MNLILIYKVKVAVYLTAFFLVYFFLLSRDTTYGRNRAFILLSFTLALILPLITFQTLKPHDIQFFGEFLSEVFITAGAGSLVNKEAGLSSQDPLQFIYLIYITGVSISLFKLIIDFGSLLYLIVHKKNPENNIIRFYGLNTAGFSAMGYIFINNKLSDEEAVEIIKHEQNHLRKNHFLDIIFIEFVQAFQWFNPAAYMFNRALRAIHEYQADKDVISSGVPVVNYQSLLFSQVFKSRVYSLTNSFSNPSLIKKRMIMMSKKQTSALAGLKLILVIPITALVFVAISAYRDIPLPILNVPPDQQLLLKSDIEKTPVSMSLVKESTSKPSVNTTAKAKPPVEKKNEPVISDAVSIPPPLVTSEAMSEKLKEAADEVATPFVVVENMPMFPGGDIELLKYIAANTVYPEEAKAQQFQGRVIVRFCVTSKGGISKASILKGVSSELDAEALRVVNTLPEFKPGTQGGKPVPVWYMVPITFTLK